MRRADYLRRLERVTDSACRLADNGLIAYTFTDTQREGLEYGMARVFLYQTEAHAASSGHFTKGFGQLLISAADEVMRIVEQARDATRARA